MTKWRFEDWDLQVSNSGNWGEAGKTDRKKPLRGEKHSEFRIEYVYFGAFGHQRVNFQVKLGYSL